MDEKMALEVYEKLRKYTLFLMDNDLINLDASCNVILEKFMDYDFFTTVMNEDVSSLEDSEKPQLTEKYIHEKNKGPLVRVIKNEVGIFAFDDGSIIRLSDDLFKNHNDKTETTIPGIFSYHTEHKMYRYLELNEIEFLEKELEEKRKRILKTENN